MSASRPRPPTVVIASGARRLSWPQRDWQATREASSGRALWLWGLGQEPQRPASVLSSTTTPPPPCIPLEERPNAPAAPPPSTPPSRSVSLRSRRHRSLIPVARLDHGPWAQGTLLVHLLLSSAHFPLALPQGKPPEPPSLPAAEPLCSPVLGARLATSGSTPSVSSNTTNRCALSLSRDPLPV